MVVEQAERGLQQRRIDALAAARDVPPDSAFTTPNAEDPVPRSTNETPQRTGAPPGSPVIDITPLNACITAS